MIVVTVIMLVLLAWSVLRSREPAYQVKSFRQWLSELSSAAGRGVDTNAAAAVRAIGPEGVPWLLDELAATDSRLKVFLMNGSRRLGLRSLPWTSAPKSDRQRLALYGFAIVGAGASNAVPVLVERLKTTASSRDAAMALSAIAGVGSLARALGPPEVGQNQTVRRMILTNLCQVMTNVDSVVRSATLDALIDFKSERRDAILLLVSLLRTTEKSVVTTLALHLKDFDPELGLVLPELLKVLKDRDPQVRIRAAMALGAYGPLARTALPALHDAADDPDAAVRDAITAAVSRIAPQARVWDPASFPPPPPLPPEQRIKLR